MHYEHPEIGMLPIVSSLACMKMMRMLRLDDNDDNKCACACRQISM